MTTALSKILFSQLGKGNFPSFSRISGFSVRGFSLDPNHFQEERIKVKDVEINYIKVGEGSHNLLLIPGALGSIWTDFKPQIKNLDRTQFTIIAYDPPGYGKSIPPERIFDNNFYEQDADTALLLMRALDLPVFSIAGWSDGGISGMILAAKYPENVNKAVIWGCNSFILPKELEGYEKIRDLNKWSKKMKDPLTALYGEEYFTKLWNGWCDAMQNIYKANKSDICQGSLHKIKCPTLILYGQKDPLVDKTHLPILEHNIKYSETHIYPEGKHDIHLRMADDFNKRITEFLLK